MQPTSLSASSVETYEACPALWKAQYIDKARGPSGRAAELGTACHSVLQSVVENCRAVLADPAPLGEYVTDSVLLNFWDREFNRMALDPKQFDEGKEMLLRWYNRNLDLNVAQVESTEVKSSFELYYTVDTPGEKTKFTVPVNYIWDRSDRRPYNGGFEIEVVDYKTVSAPITTEGLHRKIQARLYSLAARLAYPDAERIWVTYDLLRYEPVGTVFTIDEDRETWLYLQSVFKRIIEDEQAREQLNPNCRWCLRKLSCEELTKNTKAGGSLALNDPKAAADQRAQLDAARSALGAAINELDEVILKYCEQEEIFEFGTDNNSVKISARKTRDIDTTTVVQIVGEEIAAEYGKIGVSAVDLMLKDSRLSSDQRGQLKQAFTNKFSEPSVKVNPIAPLGDE